MLPEWNWRRVTSTRYDSSFVQLEGPCSDLKSVEVLFGVDGSKSVYGTFSLLFMQIDL